mgnify:CR=1 FL=1
MRRHLGVVDVLADQLNATTGHRVVRQSVDIVQRGGGVQHKLGRQQLLNHQEAVALERLHLLGRQARPVSRVGATRLPQAGEQEKKEEEEEEEEEEWEEEEEEEK